MLAGLGLSLLTGVACGVVEVQHTGGLWPTLLPVFVLLLLIGWPAAPGAGDGRTGLFAAVFGLGLTGVVAVQFVLSSSGNLIFRVGAGVVAVALCMLLLSVLVMLTRWSVRSFVHSF
ncbi:hypothetical protein [Deinococcus aquiradiocola]|uniref:hypothetical protein n=1 Tax=Deinococcus aquiradiocola TaxID=393059 RepID=UPI0016630445|nr:hypothetical protein [Deinococcus aquiradiocola]